MNLNKRLHSETMKEIFLAFPDFPSLLALLWLNQSKLTWISRSPGCPGAGVLLGALSIAQGPGACSRLWGSPPSTTTANWFVARGLASDLGSICLTGFPQKEAVRKWCVGWNTAACTPWPWSQPSPHPSAQGGGRGGGWGAPTPNCPDLSAPGAGCKAGLLPEYFLAQSEMAFPVSAICLGWGACFKGGAAWHRSSRSLHGPASPRIHFPVVLCSVHIQTCTGVHTDTDTRTQFYW